MKIFTIILFLLIPVFSIGQTSDCPYYDKYIKEGNLALQRQQFKKALNHYNTAIVHCPKKAQEVQAKILKVFDAIENLRQEAQRDEKRAKEALKQVELEQAKTKAEQAKTAQALANLKTEQVKTRTALDKADELNRKNQKLIDAFYFYDGKFALAAKRTRGQNKYGFINKDGDVIIDYQYEKGENFDETGFAQMKKSGIDYLLDTLGNEYKVAYKLKNLDSSIVALDLRNENFDDFPTEVLKHKQLQILILNGNYNNKRKFDSIPIAINTLVNLKSLHLSYCSISKIVSLDRLINLTYLELSRNQLTTVDSLKNLTNLTGLSLDGNQLTSVDGLKNLQNLTLLGVSSNQLTTIDGLENLTNLTHLGIHFNKLTNVFGLKNLTNLTHLFLHFNKLTNVDNLRNLTNLTQLNISNNQLTNVDDLKNLTNLNSLFLHFNKLTNVDDLKNLTNLNSLYLSRNPIPKEKVEELKKQLPNCEISF